MTGEQPKSLEAIARQSRIRLLYRRKAAIEEALSIARKGQQKAIKSLERSKKQLEQAEAKLGRSP